MYLASLPPEALHARLRGGFLALRMGPFAVGIHSPLPQVQQGIRQLYGDFSLADEDDFLDYRVAVSSPLSRRWLKPQAVFSFEGRVPFTPLPASQAFPMLEWGLNWVISNHAHQYLIIHAAVLEKRGRGLVMAAPPGSGKSTLCAALAAAGWRLLSDELALVSLADGRLTSLARPISLKNCSIDIVRGLSPEIVLSASCRDTAKGTVAHMKPPASSVLESGEAAEPAWIVFPKYEAAAPLQVGHPGKGEAFIELVRNTFNYPILAKDGFQAMCKLVERCSVARVTYSSLTDVLPVLEYLQGS
jgi:HprK-related kinase A